MKKFAFASILLICVIGATSAAEPTPAGQKLTLLSAIDETTMAPGSQVQLTDAAGCQYAGVLEMRNGEPRSTLEKLMDQSNNAAGSWSIAVASQTCGAIKKTISLVVPLRNIASKKFYQAGDIVFADPVK